MLVAKGTNWIGVVSCCCACPHVVVKRSFYVYAACTTWYKAAVTLSVSPVVPFDITIMLAGTDV